MSDENRLGSAEEKVEWLLRELLELRRQVVALQEQLRAIQGEVQ